MTSDELEEAEFNVVGHMGLFPRSVRAVKAAGRHMIGQWWVRLRFVPASVRFRCRGHGYAWEIFTHLTPQERLLLYSLGLRQPRGAVFVEIGSYLGASSCFLAAAAVEIGDAQVHCVDTWENDAMAEGRRDTWEHFRANIEPIASVIVTHRCRSTDAAEGFDHEIDLLFVDGDHSYDACRADVLAWLPRVKRGGVLVMHDVAWADGVRRVVNELVAPVQRGPGRVMQNTFWTRL